MVIGSHSASPLRLEAQAAAFEVEEPLLQRQTTAEPDEMAVLADDPVARDDDRNGIGADCLADGAERLRIADPGGDVGVRDRLAVRNLEQLAPHATLKRRASKVEVEGELAALAAEVLVKLIEGRGVRLIVR